MLRFVHVFDFLLFMLCIVVLCFCCFVESFVVSICGLSLLYVLFVKCLRVAGMLYFVVLWFVLWVRDFVVGILFVCLLVFVLRIGGCFTGGHTDITLYFMIGLLLAFVFNFYLVCTCLLLHSFDS